MSCSMTKPTKWHVRPANTQISLGICPVWSEFSLSAWRNHGSLATHWAYSKGSVQTGRMPRLVWVFAGCTVILLVLSCCSSNANEMANRADLDQSALKGQSDLGLYCLPRHVCPNESRHEKTCLCHMRTTKAQISLRIRAVWSAPLLFTAWIV